MTNPYQSPAAPDDARSTLSTAEFEGLRDRVLRRIRWPLLGLVVASSVGVVWTGLFAVLFLVAYLAKAVGSEEGLANIAGNGFCALYYVAIGVAYYNVRKLRAYRSAVILAVVAIIPCLSPGFLLGIPFGIWLLIALCQSGTIDVSNDALNASSATTANGVKAALR